jgi:hypothetical protein
MGTMVQRNPPSTAASMARCGSSACGRLVPDGFFPERQVEKIGIPTRVIRALEHVSSMSTSASEKRNEHLLHEPAEF